MDPFLMVSHNLCCKVLLQISCPVKKVAEHHEVNFLQTQIYLFGHITFYLEDDDEEAINFNGGTKSFTCQSIKT